MLNASPASRAVAGVGHALDQPGDVERIADHAGGADQVALAVGELGEFAQPGVGLGDVEAAEQQVERADGARAGCSRRCRRGRRAASLPAPMRAAAQADQKRHSGSSSVRPGRSWAIRSARPSWPVVR